MIVIKKAGKLEKQCDEHTENAQNSSRVNGDPGKKLTHGRIGAGDTAAVVEGVVLPTVICSRNLPKDFARWVASAFPCTRSPLAL